MLNWQFPESRFPIPFFLAGFVTVRDGFKTKLLGAWIWLSYDHSTTWSKVENSGFHGNFCYNQDLKWCPCNVAIIQPPKPCEQIHLNSYNTDKQKTTTCSYFSGHHLVDVWAIEYCLMSQNECVCGFTSIHLFVSLLGTSWSMLRPCTCTIGRVTTKAIKVKVILKDTYRMGPPR